MDSSATEQLVGFIRGFELGSVDDAVQSRMKLAFLDCVGVMIAGFDDAAPTVLRRYLEGLGGSADATVVGGARRLPAEAAANANATAAHVLDYDDECPPMIGHPSAPVLPAVLALGELEGATGRDVLSAYIVGLEVAARLGRALNPGHYGRGWHTTSTLGTMGAASAAAHLLKLDEEATASCLGIAASRAGGLRRNFGTMTKSLHAGEASAAGVRSASLARIGFTADRRIIESAQGFFAVFQQGALEPVDLGLAAPMELARSGIGLKRYPCCGCTHCAIDIVLELSQQRPFAPDDVAAVRILVSELSPKILTHHDPRTSLEAKFSMEYCVATAIANGRVGLAEFEPDRIDDPRVRGLMPRIRMVVEPTFAVIDGRFATADVEIELRDGRRMRKREEFHLGHPTRPLSAEQVAEKFEDCSRHHLEAADRSRIQKDILALESLASVRTLTSALEEVSPTPGV